MSSWRDAYFKYKNIDDRVERDFFRRGLDFSKSEPLEDIYELALLLKSVQGDRDEWYYRGQRNADWTIRPSLFRYNVNDIDHEVQKLSSLVRYLQSELQVSQEDALAIAKHYSGVLKNTAVRCWLLDVSTELLVACFFASYNANPEDIGRIYLFKSYEMDRYSSNTPKRLGEVRFISPSDVSRIERQRAAFIDGAHPDLLEGYLPLNWRFHQKENVVFTDPDLAITEEKLLWVEDEYREVIHNWEEDVWPEDVPPSKMVTPPHNPTEPVTSVDYLSTVKEWLADMDEEYEDMNDEDQQCVQDLCQIHSEIRDSDEVSMSLKSEITLQIVSFVVGFAKQKDRKTSFDDIASRYWHESGEPETDRQEVKRIISNVRPSYEFTRSWDNRYSQ